jgi:hypothetical protein
MGDQEATEQPRQLTTEEWFWEQYSNAPHLLKVGDEYFLASGEGRANQLARNKGVTVEKIINPNLNTSTTDAS